jgi:PKD repeat protein
MEKIYTYTKFYRYYFQLALLFIGSSFAIAQAPVANFSVSAVQGCAPLSVNFTNSSTGANTYLWIFGNGNFSSLANPQNVYVTAGTYSVSLIAIASNGQRDTLTRNAYITAAPGPTASFSINANSGCANQTFFQLSNSTIGAVSYFWDFDDGTSSLQASPSKQYSLPGTYSVSLLATNSNGCQSVYNLPQPVVINPVPSPNFSANATSACSPTQAFVFSPTVTNASSYLWTFGDGTSSTAASPTKTYSNPGTYSVKLKITNSFGCSDSLIRQNYITVLTPVNPIISSTVTTGCAPVVSNLTCNVPNASSYAWNFGNGQTSTTAFQSVNYSQAGTYSPQLTVTMANGCSYSSSSNPIIQVNPNPVAQFNVSNSNGCAPLTPVINNTSTGAVSYNWAFGDGSASTDFQPSPTFTNGGLFFVRLIATSALGCISQLHVNGAINVTTPLAQFVANNTSGCPPLSVQFTNQGTTNANYLWDFGDGTTSTQINPTHTYNQLGNYDVSLVVTNGVGCQDTTLLLNFVNVENEQAIYTPPPAITSCSPFTASFNIQQIPGETYTWDFGDGTILTGIAPTHVYEVPGTYNVSLLVNNGSPCGTIYTTYQTIIIEGQIPEFTVSVGQCPPHPVTFNDNVSDAVTWLWDFGDGTTSTEESPTHIYPNMLAHHVSLTTTTASGCQYSNIGFNAVNFSTAFATFTTSYFPGPYPLSVVFESTNPAATSWLWNFGDGTTSTEANPTHIYQTDGDYIVTLLIETPGCSLFGQGIPVTENSIDVTENEGTGGSNPSDSEILSEPLKGCAPINVSFLKQDQSHLVTMWNFGDGTTSTLQNPMHLYTNPGVYTIYYTAITPYGVDTFQYQQSILLGGGIPDFSLTPTAFCDYTQVDVALYNPQSVSSILWNFGGLATDTSLSASYNFLNANNAYTIQVRVTDTLGCKSSRMKSILPLRPEPVINYPTSVCNDTIQFTHNLTNLPGYSYLWEFGDGTTSTEASPAHYYQAEGIYQITLHLTTPEGCDLDYVLPNQITFANPIPSHTLSVSEGCAPLTITFTNTTSNLSQASWFFTNGWWSLAEWNGGQYLGPKTITFPSPGTYGLYQRVTSNLIPTCVVQELFDSAFTVYGAEADFSFNQQGLCVPIQAQFTDLSTDAVAWNWDFGNGQTSNLQNPSITVTEFPVDSISLTITNIHGCTATKKKLGLATLTGTASATYIGNCNPLPVQFQSSTVGIASWAWDFGDGTTSSISNPNHIYTQNGNYNANVIITSNENCVDTVYMTVPIDVDGPTAAFHSPTPANCAPSVVEFFDTSSQAVAWLWDFGDGTSATVQNPVKLYDNPGTYDVSLIVTNANGCSDTLLMVNYVTVLGPATSFSVSNISACIGSTINFTDLSNGAVEWEWNFGEGNTSVAQNPSFTYNETGNFIVTLFSQDTLGCSAFYTIQAPIQIHPYPSANFALSDTTSCAPFSFSASNTSTGAQTYQWNINGNATSTQFEPNFNLPDAGEYTIQLIATNSYGCSDSVSLSGVESYLVPIANFSVSGTEGCTPLSVTFNNSSYQTQSPSYLWTFGNGNTSTQINPTEVYYNPDFYSVSLNVTNQNGCANTITLPSLIHVFDTLPAPVCPIIRVTVANTQSVVIEWEESLAPDFGSYQVLRKNLQSGIFELITEISDAHTLTYTDQGLNTLDNVYCYKIRTFDRCGYNVETDSLIAHCSVNVETTTRLDNTIAVDWTPYIGKTPSQYRIYRTEENTNNIEDIGTVSGDVTTFIDSMVFCPVKFRYDIKAEGLNGQWHVESNSDFDLSDPLPNLFENQQVNASRSTVVQNRYVLSEWTPPAIMGNRVTAYKVFRSTDNIHYSLLTTIPAPQTYYVDQNVDVDNVKYYYRILATNACELEGIEGGISDNVVLKAEPAGEFYTQLKWTAYEGWGEDGVSFYILERQKDDGEWEVLHQLPGSVITAVDEN